MSRPDPYREDHETELSYAFGYGFAVGACCGAFAVLIIFYLLGVRLA